MSAYRSGWGAAAWLLTLQFFVVETVAQLRSGTAYSRTDDLISTLGAATSPAHGLMNASFVVQGGLIAAGAALLRPALLGSGGRLAPAFLGTAAVGVLLVGLFPQDGQPTLHQAGAGLYLVGGGLGLVALAYAVRPRSEALATTLAALGVGGLAMTVILGAGVTRYLGEGGTERAAAYVLPIGLAVAGAGLWRLERRQPAAAASRPSRGEVRTQERAERAARRRERDDALEAAAGRAEQPATSGGARPPATRPGIPGTAAEDTGADHTGADDTGAEDVEPDERFDPEDPWAHPRRRRA